MRRKLMIGIVAGLGVAACAKAAGVSAIAGFDDLVSQVQKHRVGSDSDQWIEMKNLAGEWEKTGLIFGYNGAAEECAKAIAGLRQVNYRREYRCTPAN